MVFILPFELYLLVKMEDGYKFVTDFNPWGLISANLEKEIEGDMLRIIYIKYLHLLVWNYNTHKLGT